MAVKRKYRLNLRNYGNLPAIMLSQYDEGYALEFEIRDGTDAASDLSAYTVTLKGTRADTLAYSFSGTISTNVLTFVIDTTMTACAGRGTAEIAIKDTANDVLFATFNMPVFVERAAVPEGSIDADVERAQEIAEQVQEIVDNAAANVSGEAEKWATGQINGTDVPSTDPTYENNAKYYAEQAADAAASIGIDATLTQAGKAADAKKTGDEITALKEDLQDLDGEVVKTVNGIAPTSGNVNVTVDADAVTDAQSMADMTDTEKLYRYDGKIYYYNGTEWTEVGTGADSDDVKFIESVKKNLIDKSALTEGSIDTSDGIVKTRSNIERSRWSSDFIPVQKADVLKGFNLNVCVFYDENKAFVIRQSAGNTSNVVIPDGVAYVRVDFVKTNVDVALFCHLEYMNEPDDTIYVSVDETGRHLITKTLPTYASENPLFFQKTRNLFDYLNDHYYIKCKINTTTGAYEYNSWDSTVPDSTNAYITPMEFYPVSYGQTLFCNYYCWASAYYDADKNYLGALPQRDAFVGWVVPEGCAYVRVSFKGSNATPTPDNAISNLSEMHKVILYTVDTDQTIAPKPMDGLLKYQIDGKMISPNYLDTVIPNMADSEFLSAMKCLAIREVNKRDHAYRFGNFNMWVTQNKTGWYMARKMFMDYGLDFCGLEEVNTSSDISKFMKSWQFPYGFDTNFSDGEATIDKSLLSRFPVQSSRKLYTTSSGSSVALLNSKIQLPRLNDVYNPKRVLSVYVVHLPITSDTYKVSVANEILAFIASDTSDYIIIFGDTNDFATTEEGKLYWRTFESGGFSPVIPITTKTVTQDNLTITEGDESAAWRNHSIDQFLISSNIEAVSYGVVNTKDEYGLASISGSGTDNEPALSDHDFVYADLVFKDEVRQ